jgi:hypothetical protein
MNLYKEITWNYKKESPKQIRIIMTQHSNRDENNVFIKNKKKKSRKLIDQSIKKRAQRVLSWHYGIISPRLNAIFFSFNKYWKQDPPEKNPLLLANVTVMKNIYKNIKLCSNLKDNICSDLDSIKSHHTCKKAGK